MKTKKSVEEITSVGLFLLMLLLGFSSRAQQKPARLLGLNPAVTAEPFYEKGELDINLFPLVYQHTLSKRMDIRFNTILNLGLRNAGNQLSHFGLETGFPFYFSAKEDKSRPSKGFYTAPGVSLTRNRLENHTNFGLWIEPGYQLSISKKYSISFGVQWGGTYFRYDHNPNKWGQHFGVKIIIGRWLI